MGSVLGNHSSQTRVCDRTSSVEMGVERLKASHEDLLFDLRLLLADGAQVRGADVYRYLMRRIWWAYPLFLLLAAPLLRNAFD